MPHVQESSEPAGEKYKRPPFCEQLFSLFGHTPRDSSVAYFESWLYYRPFYDLWLMLNVSVVL